MTPSVVRAFLLGSAVTCRLHERKFNEWYATLNAEQRQRVDKVLIAEYGE
jgi:hypothetical protein